MDAWVAELHQGRFDAAWDLFLDRYRRLIFAAIRHCAQDYDDVMDIFARACEALREDRLRRLRAYTGIAYCWGSNGWGQLGDGSTVDSAVPVKVAGQP